MKCYLNKMSHNHINVILTPGQVKKLQSKNYVTSGIKINLKQQKLPCGPNKLSPTKIQLNRFNKVKTNGMIVQLTVLEAAVNNIIKSGGFIPCLIPAFAAIATGALSGVACWGAKKVLDKVTGSRYRKKSGKDSDYPEADSQDYHRTSR